MSLSDDLTLVDHHCHGLLGSTPTPDEFRLLSTESDWLTGPGLETLDAPVGFAIRALCAPMLDLERHAPMEEYLCRRSELGGPEVERRLMAASHTGELLIDTGFVASNLLAPAQMEATFGIRSREIVRLEAVAERVAPTTTATGFADAFLSALTDAQQDAVGFKSIVAYRYGFDLSPTPPTAAEVAAAAGEWLAVGEATNRWRLEHPVLLQHLLWAATVFGKPIQMHAGYGDKDIELFRADPSRATRFFEATRSTGATFTLLHCYPFIRESAILAQVFPHVYCDAGAVSHFLGASATTAIRHLLEMAPFNKVLYSSDAHALAEQYLISSETWRRGLDTVLGEWVADDWTTSAEARRVAELICSGNARRLYALDGAA